MRIGSRGCLYVGHPSLALFSLIFNTRPGFFKYREENIVVMKDDGIISGLQPTKANIVRPRPRCHILTGSYMLIVIFVFLDRTDKHFD